MNIKRLYRCKDHELLDCAHKMYLNTLRHVAELSTVDDSFTKLNIEEFLQKIEQANDIIKQKKNISEHNYITQQLHKLQHEAINDLCLLRKFIYLTCPVEFEKYLKILGFSKHLNRAMRGSMKSLLILLEHFQSVVTPDIVLELKLKGIKEVMIHQIVPYTEKLKTLMNKQNQAKNVNQQMTYVCLLALNHIYEETTHFGKKAYHYYQKKQSDKKFLFSFHQLLKTAV